MNFDAADVGTFLGYLNKNIAVNFDIAALTEFADSVSVGNEKSKVVSVRFGGTDVKVRFVVYMDDIDAADLYFFSTDSSLIEAIDSQMFPFAEERGM